MLSATENERVITRADSGIVAAVGVDTFFFVARSNHQPCVSADSKQKYVGFDGVVVPVRRTGQKFCAPLVGVVAHHALPQLPSSAQRLPLVCLAPGK